MKNKIPFDPYEDKNNPELYKIDSIPKFENFYSSRRELIINYLCDCFDVK